MAARRTEALVTPRLLSWARTQAGLSLEIAASRLGAKTAVLAAWEGGGRRPTMNQARELAALYGQPLGVLYLDSPPAVTPPPADYRGRSDHDVYSPELLAQVRHAAALRDAAVELAEENDRPFARVSVTADIGENPDLVAERIRDWVGAPDGFPKPWKGPAEAFKWWRSRIEDKGVLVFIIRGVENEEMSGFTLTFDRAPVIGINGADSPARRLFSLLHELAHVLLRAEGVSLIDADAASRTRTARVERFCNEVAASALMPEPDVLAHSRVSSRRSMAVGDWDIDDVKKVAGDFGVSIEALYVRLVTLRLARLAGYVAWKKRLSRLVDEPEAPVTGGPDFYRLKIHDLGLPYLRSVYEAYHSQLITLADVCEYLGVRAETAHKLETKVEREMLKAS